MIKLNQSTRVLLIESMSGGSQPTSFAALDPDVQTFPHFPDVLTDIPSFQRAGEKIMS